MNLLVIGATGRTGKHVLEQGLRREHAMTAFTRHPEQLAGIQGLRGIVQGDATNLDEVRQAVRGQDAVIAAVGGSGIARTLIAAMREEGVQRLVMTSSRSVVATRPWLPVTLAWMIFHTPYADLARAEGMIEVSGLNWTIVRGAMLTDKPGSGQVHMDFEPNTTGGALTLTRADYAMTLLDVVEDPQMSEKALGVGGTKPAKRGANRPGRRATMSKREQAQWMVSGIVEAPIEQVWKGLLESNPDLSPDDKEAISAQRGPDLFTTSSAKPGGGQVHLEVDKRHHRLSIQGEWWYRGVYSVEPDEQGSRLIYRVYNVASGAGWWVAQLIQGPQYVRTMRTQMQDQLRLIGERVGCTFRLVAQSGGSPSELSHHPNGE